MYDCHAAPQSLPPYQPHARPRQGVHEFAKSRQSGEKDNYVTAAAGMTPAAVHDGHAVNRSIQ